MPQLATLQRLTGPAAHGRRAGNAVRKGTVRLHLRERTDLATSRGVTPVTGKGVAGRTGEVPVLVELLRVRVAVPHGADQPTLLLETATSDGVCPRGRRVRAVFSGAVSAIEDAQIRGRASGVARGGGG